MSIKYHTTVTAILIVVTLSFLGMHNVQAQNSVLNWYEDPNFGSVELSAGFLPDPHNISLTSGGSVDVNNYLKIDSCVGWASEAPDFRLNWSGDTSELSIYFIAEELDADATLIINAPDGKWYCNDDADFDTYNPLVTFYNAQEGQYDIWVGSYEKDDYHFGTLKISELSSSRRPSR